VKVVCKIMLCFEPAEWWGQTSNYAVRELFLRQ